MVRIHPDPPVRQQRSGNRPAGTGAVAQLGEHLLCKQGVVGSIPSSSTSASPVDCGCEAAFDPGSSSEGPASRAASFFNNLEGKASMGLMRACGR